MFPSSSSYDDRPYASGVLTTKTSGSFCMDVNAPKWDSFENKSSESDMSMDRTQSAEEQSKSYKTPITSTTEVTISPLKISYTKPNFYSLLQYKTLSHIIATFLVPFILVNTVLIFQSTTFVFDYQKNEYNLAGLFDSMALMLSLCHVIIWFFRKQSTQKSANLTFWVTVLTTGSLTIAGVLLLTFQPPCLKRQKTIFPLQYICFFGSILATISSFIAVFYEWKASKYGGLLYICSAHSIF